VPKTEALVNRRGERTDQTVEEDVDRNDRRDRRPAPLKLIADRQQDHPRRGARARGGEQRENVTPAAIHA
jgi:hypothetical protein